MVTMGVIHGGGRDRGSFSLKLCHQQLFSLPNNGGRDSLSRIMLYIACLFAAEADLFFPPLHANPSEEMPLSSLGDIFVWDAGKGLQATSTRPRPFLKPRLMLP